MHSHMSACTHACMHVRLMTRLDSREYIRRLEALVMSGGSKKALSELRSARVSQMHQFLVHASLSAMLYCQSLGGHGGSSSM